MLSESELIRELTVRPAMYVGKIDIHAVRHFIDGYCAGRPAPNVKQFFRWLRDFRESIEGPSAYGWDQWLLARYSGDHGEALHALLHLYTTKSF